MYRSFFLYAAFLIVAIVRASAQQASPQTPSPLLPPSSPAISPLSQPTILDNSADSAEDSPRPAAPPQRQEDWTVLSVEKSGLDLVMAQGPVLQTWETPEFTRQLVRLQWRPSDPMDVYVIHPHGVKNPPTILYLYDYLSDTERFRDDGWCKRVTANGFAAVGMVSALSGHRFHAPRPMKQWFVSELQETLATSTHDVQMILNYLQRRNDLEVSKVGMFAEGSGAAVAVLAASADPRITVLDLLDPWGDWPAWLRDTALVPEDQRPNYLQPEFLAKVTNLDPVTYLPQLKTQTVRIEFVPDEDGTPKSARDAIVAAAPKTANVIVYKDSEEHYKAWKVSGLSGWIQSQLQKQSPQKETEDLTAMASGRHR